MSGALEALGDEVRAEGGLLAPTVVAEAPAGRFEALEPAYALLAEAIYEGYRLHYAEGRVLRPEDPDLALLAGDGLYARGLAELAELGDLDAVRLLADAISDCARAHAEGDPGATEVIWDRVRSNLPAPSRS